MKTQKKQKTLSPIENVKLFKACEVNHNRKTYNKLWVDVKEEALPIVEEFGGSVISKYKTKSYYIEIAKKNTTRFDIKKFKKFECSAKYSLYFFGYQMKVIYYKNPNCNY